MKSQPPRNLTPLASSSVGLIFGKSRRCSREPLQNIAIEKLICCLPLPIHLDLGCMLVTLKARQHSIFSPVLTECKASRYFFPVGWDAFGLPAENYAIKTGTPPVTTTRQAIDTFRSQIKRLAISYDWKSELATCHPGYYRWTQWLFLQLYQAGLAYQGMGTVNWCPSCQTVLANEQVVDGTCERCGTKSCSEADETVVLQDNQVPRRVNDWSWPGWLAKCYQTAAT